MARQQQEQQQPALFEYFAFFLPAQRLLLLLEGYAIGWIGT